jgi:excisionase family DNA binding protein
LGISIKTFVKVLKEGEIPGRKIGREWKFSRKALVDWVGGARAKDFLRVRKKKHPPAETKRETPPSQPRTRPASPRGRMSDTFSIEED